MVRRGRLGEQGELPEAADRYLQADAQTLQWLPDSPFYLDVAELERAIGQGEPAVALELYRGELLPSCYDDWILPERERLRALFAGAMEREARRLEEARERCRASRSAFARLVAGGLARAEAGGFEME